MAHDWQDRRLADHLRPELRIVFVGINPGKWSAARGHHFAGPTNHFWKLLHDAGLVPERLGPEDDHRLPEFGYGITNMVARPSPGEQALTDAELEEGARRLREKLVRVRPRVACLLGKRIYRHYAGLGPAAPVAWGLQPEAAVPGVQDYLAPNPSARSTLPYAERLRHFEALRRLAFGAGARDAGGRGAGGRDEGIPR